MNITLLKSLSVAAISLPFLLSLMSCTEADMLALAQGIEAMEIPQDSKKSSSQKSSSSSGSSNKPTISNSGFKPVTSSATPSRPKPQDLSTPKPKPQPKVQPKPKENLQDVWAPSIIDGCKLSFEGKVKNELNEVVGIATVFQENVNGVVPVYFSTATFNEQTQKSSKTVEKNLIAKYVRTSN